MRADPLPFPLPAEADAYLQWGAWGGFRYLFSPGGWIGAIAQFREPLASDVQIRRFSELGGEIPSLYLGHRYVGVQLFISRLAEQLDYLIDIGLIRIELAAPVTPARPESRLFGFDIENVQHATNLVGIVDHGCPFAHLDYRLTGGTTRVAFVWDQGGTPSVGAPFFYGAVLYRGLMTTLMQKARDASGQVDENAAYEASGLPGLRSAASHGAMVLSQASGPLPLRARVSPSRFAGRDATAPPLRNSEECWNTDIAFIQLPKVALDDSSGLWLGQFALDGIMAIRAYAELARCNGSVVANLSYGPQTGPHDGTSALEEAIDALIATPPPATSPFCFYVTLPAGNSHLARAHAEIDLCQQGGCIDWHLAPDSQTPTFTEVWLPPGVMPSMVTIQISGPDGDIVTAQTGKICVNAADTMALLMGQGPASSNRLMALIVVAPTTRPSRSSTAYPLAAPGRWKISVVPTTASLPASCTAHVWLARNDYNVGGAHLGHAGYLRTAQDEPERFRRVDEQLDSPGLRAGTAVGVVARGNMSGIATSSNSQVAGGYRLGDYEPGLPYKPAMYSGGGPTSGVRGKPDWVYPTEESRVFPGILCAGNRSATVMRLSGTSTAAPQYARDLAAWGNAALTPTPITLGPTRWIERIGQGYK